MKTKSEIRFDLQEIRFYYANQIEFDIAAKSIGPSAVIKKVAEYNNAIAQAPAKLYLLYFNLYVNGKTQLAYAVELDISAYHVFKLNCVLCNYLTSYFGNNG